jgi:hypothetical protein
MMLCALRLIFAGRTVPATPRDWIRRLAMGSYKSGCDPPVQSKLEFRQISVEGSLVTGLRKAAAERDTSVDRLVKDILTAVLNHKLFDAVLGDD